MRRWFCLRLQVGRLLPASCLTQPHGVIVTEFGEWVCYSEKVEIEESFVLDSLFSYVFLSTARASALKSFSILTKKKMTRPICPFNTSIKGKWLAHQYIDICRSCFYKAKIIPASRKTFWQLNNGYI